MELDETLDSGEWEVIKSRKRNTGGESTYLSLNWQQINTDVWRYEIDQNWHR